MSFSIETCCALNVGDRAEQQDRVAVFAHPKYKGTLMAVLADGIGGTSGGAMAAEQVIFKAKQSFDNYGPRSETVGYLLKNAMYEAHQVIRLMRYASAKEPHSTAVIFMLTAQGARWAHCGDSRLYYFRGETFSGKTEDHSLVGDLLRQGKISPEVALLHPQRNVLLSCLGTPELPDIKLSPLLSLEPGDNFVLCSDGAWAYFTPEELGRVVHKLPAREAAAFIIDMARSRAAGRGDNISIAIVKLLEKDEE